MREKMKIDWVNAVVANRLQYAMRKECEVFISYFLTERDLKKYKWHHIYDEESAIKFWKTFSFNPNGGGTEISEVIDGISKEILDNKRLFNLDVDLSHERPEILVLNDGNDHVSTAVDWKTNAITIGQHNRGLKNLCKDTGGTYVNFM